MIFWDVFQLQSRPAAAPHSPSHRLASERLILVNPCPKLIKTVKKLDSPSESILSLHPAGDVSLEGKKKKENYWKELRCPPSRSERSETKCSTMDFTQSCNAPLRSPVIPLFFLSLSSNNRMHLMIAAARWNPAALAAFIQMYKDCRKKMHYTDTFTLAGTIARL